MLEHVRAHDQVAAAAAVHAEVAALLEVHLPAIHGARRDLDDQALARARRRHGVAHLLRDAAERVLGAHVDGQRDVVALARAIRGATAHAAESLGKAAEPAAIGAAEDGAEEVVQIDVRPTAAICIRAATARHAAEHEQLVVFLALLRIGERLVRFADLLELLFIAARVGMVLLRELAKCGLDFLVGGVARNAQDIVEILLRHDACLLP